MNFDVTFPCLSVAICSHLDSLHRGNEPEQFFMEFCFRIIVCTSKSYSMKRSEKHTFVKHREKGVGTPSFKSTRPSYSYCTVSGQQSNSDTIIKSFSPLPLAPNQTKVPFYLKFSQSWFMSESVPNHVLEALDGVEATIDALFSSLEPIVNVAPKDLERNLLSAQRAKFHLTLAYALNASFAGSFTFLCVFFIPVSFFLMIVFLYPVHLATKGVSLEDHPIQEEIVRKCVRSVVNLTNFSYSFDRKEQRCIRQNYKDSAVKVTFFLDFVLKSFR